jgi:hypothetical protein
MRENSAQVICGLERQLEALGDRGGPDSQATDLAAAVASSSNALEMSRMLMTPIRL